MLSRPARNSLSYVGSIEMPCESTPRRSVSTITSAVVSACASDMPHARNTDASCSWILFDGTRMAGLQDHEFGWPERRGRGGGGQGYFVLRSSPTRAVRERPRIVRIGKVR